MGLPDGRKGFKINLMVFDTIPECDRQTDGRTDRQTDRQTRCRSKDCTTIYVAQIILLRTIWNCNDIHVLKVNPELICRMMDVGPQTYGLFSVDYIRNIGVHFIEIVIHSRWNDTTFCMYALSPVVGGCNKIYLAQILRFVLRFVKFPPQIGDSCGDTYRLNCETFSAL